MTAPPLRAAHPHGARRGGPARHSIVPRVWFAMGGDFSWLSDEEATLQIQDSAFYVPELENDPDHGPFMRIDALPS